MYVHMHEAHPVFERVVDKASIKQQETSSVTFWGLVQEREKKTERKRKETEGGNEGFISN